MITAHQADFRILAWDLSADYSADAIAAAGQTRGITMTGALGIDSTTIASPDLGSGVGVAATLTLFA